MTAIGEEYSNNAKSHDEKYFDIHDGTGPVMRRLGLVGPILGVAAGRYGELSASGQTLVTTMAEARVKQQDLAWARGEDEDKTNLAYEVGYIRRRLSRAIVIAFGRRLASRMGQVGSNEREAVWLEGVQGNSIVNRGRFWRG